jgi:hypothetical protein
MVGEWANGKQDQQSNGQLSARIVGTAMKASQGNGSAVCDGRGEHAIDDQQDDG